MSRQIKRTVICFILVLTAWIGRPASAQIYHPEVTFKDSLVLKNIRRWIVKTASMLRKYKMKRFPRRK